MKKAVAIPYIIALIIGVIVIAVLAYWFISSGGKGNTIANDAECTARKAEYCVSKSVESETKANQVCPIDWKTKKVSATDDTPLIDKFCASLIRK